MSSLFRLLFDTMPLACAEGAVYKRTGLELDRQSLRLLREYMHFSTDPTGRLLENPPVPDEVRGADRNRIPIWGFDGSKDCNNFYAINCRVQSDEFKKYTVLRNLSFARKVDGQLESSVEVEFGPRHKFNLTLSERSRLATFMTSDGYNPPNRHELWPLEAWEDCGLLHVHVFDIELITGHVTLLADLPDDHRDKAEVKAFLDRCALFDDIPPDAPAGGELFKDDLFRRYGSDVEALKVLDPSAVLGAAKDLVQLRILTARVVVCCSLTLNRAFDDYVSERATWMGRLYPHVMVRSTIPMTKVVAGIYFERPAKTTIEGNLPCGCGEMNADIDTLLVADNNKDNVSKRFQSAAPPTWDQIFGYSLPSAATNLRGVRAKVAKRSKHAPSRSTVIEGAVIRMGDIDNNKVERVTGQGAFDNFHMAPSMKLPKTRSASTIDGDSISSDNILRTDLTESDRSSWHFDDVRMAPFCAHDCFHMHWRWLNMWPDAFLCGYDGHVPNCLPGAPMVPENQDVFLEVLSPIQVLYEVEAGLFPSGAWMDPDRWQVICHHGAAYALDAGIKTWLAKRAGPLGAFGTWTNFAIPDADNSWASFYWNLRYFVNSERKVQERIVIIDLQALLDA